MSEQSMLKRIAQHRELIMNGMAVVFLSVAFVISMVQINKTHQVYFDPTKDNLRIAHWQLELGYRDALQSIIQDYEALHPKVRIQQVPITEKFYAQVINTHLVGNTAPDMMEMGFSNMVSQDQYLARYFEPMSVHASEVNRYNDGTELEGMAWRETFIDGMRTMYRPTLQDYFGIPSSTFTLRIYYNTKMFKEVVGTDEPPRTFGELMTACRKIQDYARQNHLELVPIAGSKYNSPFFFYRYGTAFLSHYEEVLDTNVDGSISGMELYEGILNGKLSWSDPVNKACYELFRDLSETFQKGFMAVGREQAAFLFVQENAAMITSGSWDAESLFRQARFKIGIFDFPMPAPGEKYADLVRGRGTEAATGTGNAFGICRYSKYRDIAIDFMRYLTSQPVNQKFNRAINWIPAVIGARPTKELEVFLPNPVGFSTSLSWYWGGRSYTAYQGALSAFVQGEIGFDEFGGKVVDAIKSYDYGWHKAAQEEFEAQRSTVRIQEQLLGILDSDVLRPTPFYRSDYDRRYMEAMIRQVRTTHLVNEYLYRFRKDFNSDLSVE